MAPYEGPNYCLQPGNPKAVYKGAIISFSVQGRHGK